MNNASTSPDFSSGPFNEPRHHHRHLICWKSTFAGFALALMTFAGVIALALAFGGIGLSDGATVQNAGLFAGAAVVVASALSIFAGSYLSVRLARFKTDVVGSAQGLVLGSLVVLFVIWQAVSAVGMIGRGVAEATGAAAVAGGATTTAPNPALQDMIEDSLGGVTLKSDSATVVRGVTARLLRGDQESAKNYLAYQAGLTPAEAEARIATLKQKGDEVLVKAREASATALKTSGWSLFLLIAISAMSAVLGGLLGSQVNLRRTLDVTSTVIAPKRNEQKIFQKQPAR